MIWDDEINVRMIIAQPWVRNHFPCGLVKYIVISLHSFFARSNITAGSNDQISMFLATDVLGQVLNYCRQSTPYDVRWCYERRAEQLRFGIGCKGLMCVTKLFGTRHKLCRSFFVKGLLFAEFCFVIKKPPKKHVHWGGENRFCMGFPNQVWDRGPNFVIFFTKNIRSDSKLINFA